MKSLKSFLNYIIAAAIALVMMSCEEEVEKPSITVFSAEPATAEVGQPVIFTVEHTGTYAVIWSGKPGNDYAAYKEQIANVPADVERNIVSTHDKGAIVVGGTYQTTYNAAGTYTAVLIVTNAGNMGETFERAEQSIQITIQ